MYKGWFCGLVMVFVLFLLFPAESDAVSKIWVTNRTKEEVVIRWIGHSGWNDIGRGIQSHVEHLAPGQKKCYTFEGKRLCKIVRVLDSRGHAINTRQITENESMFAVVGKRGQEKIICTDLVPVLSSLSLMPRKVKNEILDYLLPQVKERLRRYTKRRERKMLELPDLGSPIVFRPDGRIMALGSGGGNLAIWDTYREKRLHALRRCGDNVVFSPRGDLYAVSPRDSSIRLFNSGTGEEKGVLQGHRDGVTCFAFSPDGTYMVSGSLDHTLKVWDVANKRAIRTFSCPGKVVESIAFSPSGEALITRRFDGTIQILDTTEGQEIHMRCPLLQIVDAIAISNTYVAFQSIVDGSIRIVDTRNWQEIQHLRVPNMQAGAIAISPGGEYMAAGCLDHTITLWGIRSGRLIGTFQKATGSFAFRNEKEFAMGLDDGTIHLWNIESSKTVHVLSTDGASIKSIMISPDRTYLAAELFDAKTRKSKVRIWRLQSEEDVDIEEMLSWAYQFTPQQKWLVYVLDQLRVVSLSQLEQKMKAQYHGKKPTLLNFEESYDDFPVELKKLIQEYYHLVETGKEGKRQEIPNERKCILS